MLTGSARGIVAQRGGMWRDGHGLMRCPLPGHGRGRGDLNPSLSIAAGDRQPVIVHCFAGCDPIDVLRALGGDHVPNNPSSAAFPTNDRHWSAAWDKGAPLADNAAGIYLGQFRRVVAADGLAELGDALRFHRAAPFSKDGSWQVPGLMAAVRNGRGELIGLQVTGLRSDGFGKIAARKVRHTFGRISGGAVQLGQPQTGRRNLALAVAEGVETALGFNRLSGYSCWAALGGSLACFVPPPDLDELVIAADHDDAGLRLAYKLATRLRERCPSLFVEVRHPTTKGHDWADEAHAAFSDG